MDETDLSAHEGEIGNSPDTRLTRIRLWTRTLSAQSQEPVRVDEPPATARIADLSSIAARFAQSFHNSLLHCSLASRNHSPPTPLPASTRNGASRTNHISLTNGHSVRSSAHFSDRSERARALFTKYGIDPQESDWTMPTNKPVQRVERSIRMRIRFWCHLCSTLYGNSRVCSQCMHQRCNRCVRHPPRRTTPRVRLADAARASNALSAENLHAFSMAEPAPAADPPVSQHISTPITPQGHANGGRATFHTMEAPTISQQESLQEGGTCSEYLDPNFNRIAKRHRMRVHHTCHECLRTFSPGESTCSACGHERCKDCPRDPPRRRQRGAGPSNRTSEHMSYFFGSDSDDGGDEHENETAGPETRTSTVQSASAAVVATSPLRPSTIEEGSNARDTTVAAPEPPPPI